MHTQAISSRNRLNDLQVDAQSGSEYVGGYSICVGENGYSLFTDEASSGLFSQNDHDDEIVEVFLPPSKSSSSAP